MGLIEGPKMIKRWLCQTIVFPLFFSVGLFAQPRLFSLNDSGVTSLIHQNYTNQQVVLVAETHNSSASFKFHADKFLSHLRKQGFNCLLLERNKSQLEYAYRAFNSGVSFESSIESAVQGLNNRIYEFAISDESKEMAELARNLGFRIFAMDSNMGRSDIDRKLKMSPADRYASHIINTNLRNQFMVREMDILLNRRECQKAVAVVGAEHVFVSGSFIDQQVVVRSMPEYLAQLGRTYMAIRLLPRGKQLEVQSDVYTAVFVR